MKSKKSIQASLKILLLLEEFTESELKEAVRMLEGEFDSENPVIIFLQSRFHKQNRSHHDSDGNCLKNIYKDS